MLPWWTKLRWPVLSIDGSCHVWNSQKPEEFRPGADHSKLCRTAAQFFSCATSIYLQGQPLRTVTEM
jgi:hypothetical protein